MVRTDRMRRMRGGSRLVVVNCGELRETVPHRCNGLTFNEYKCLPLLKVAPRFEVCARPADHVGGDRGLTAQARVNLSYNFGCDIRPHEMTRMISASIGTIQD